VSEVGVGEREDSRLPLYRLSNESKLAGATMHGIIELNVG